MNKFRFVLFGFVMALTAADKSTAPELIQLSKNPGDPAFAAAIRSTFSDKELKTGQAIVGEGENFIWVIESDQAPDLVMDDEPVGSMTRIANTSLFYRAGAISTGRSHKFDYRVAGKVIATRNDVPAYGPESYQKPGVPEGKLSEKLTCNSKIYDGMVCDWWIYAPAQYDAAKPAALMVWQDGQRFVERNGGTRGQNVFDNLTAEGKIPVMIQVFISPGKVGDKAMRSIEYDTVDDRYAKFLEQEIIPEVAKRYNLRNDAYSRGIGGDSSGGICAFNAAWQRNDLFTRVISHIGSFTSIQWHPGEIDGGNVYPFKIRKEPKRNIRVWLQDGTEDIENQFGSWPLQNLQMANSLKMRDYDFHLSWGNNTHNGANGNAELPEELIWLWRDYDPAKTEQIFLQDSAEKDKPLFRVKALNR